MLREYQEWLPSAEFEEMSFDEVGVWFEILEPGRDAWRKWMWSLGKEPEERDWQVELVDLRDLLARERQPRARDGCQTSSGRARPIAAELSYCHLRKSHKMMR